LVINVFGIVAGFLIGGAYLSVATN